MILDNIFQQKFTLSLQRILIILIHLETELARGQVETLERLHLHLVQPCCESVGFQGSRRSRLSLLAKIESRVGSHRAWGVDRAHPKVRLELTQTPLCSSLSACLLSFGQLENLPEVLRGRCWVYILPLLIETFTLQFSTFCFFIPEESTKR